MRCFYSLMASDSFMASDLLTVNKIPQMIVQPQCESHFHLLLFSNRVLGSSFVLFLPLFTFSRSSGRLKTLQRYTGINHRKLSCFFSIVLIYGLQQVLILLAFCNSGHHKLRNKKLLACTFCTFCTKVLSFS